MLVKAFSDQVMLKSKPVFYKSIINNVGDAMGTSGGDDTLRNAASTITTSANSTIVADNLTTNKVGGYA